MAFLTFEKTCDSQNAIEVAFALADSGDFATVKQIKEHLQREGYNAYSQLHGSLLSRQLKQRITQAAARKVLPK